jgi:bifunctional ADP-heptose synthase (sugar kinase/adenylyltransferase)
LSQVLVIGETCVDIFVYCEAGRLAPDFPVPVLSRLHEISNPGMAKNVQLNLQALGLECDLSTNESWKTVTKTRYVHEATNHMFLRVDTSHDIPPLRDIPSLDVYDAVVIADYDKGFLSRNQIAEICKRHDMVFLDTKKPLGAWAMDARFIKINDFEYGRSLPLTPPELESKLIHTLGAGGAQYHGKTIAVEPVEIKDSSGAGDAFMAAFVSRFLETQDVYASIDFANTCASGVVRKRGVTVIEVD